MSYCGKCASFIRDRHFWHWEYCAQCGRQLCDECCRGRCCQHSPAKVDDYFLRHARKVEYVLVAQGGKRQVYTRAGESLRPLSTIPSLRVRNLYDGFYWGMNRAQGARRHQQELATNQLSIAILLDFFCREDLAASLYERFSSCVTRKQEPCGLITRNTFRNWMSLYPVNLIFLCKTQ
jgi:hypothetical protein